MRSNRLRTLWWIGATTVMALGLPAPGAFAYWSSAGEANAAANLATLSSPTISSATPGAGTVELTWSAVTPPGGGTVEYYVTRDGGAPGGGCPSSSSRSTATSCTDTGVSIGTHEYTVTAVWRTWTATSTVKSAAVNFGPATHFQLEVASATPTAGEADSITIVAKDASNNTVGTYSGAKTLAWSGAASSPSGHAPEYPAGATSVTFTKGVGKATGIKLYDAASTTLTVEEGSSLEGTSGVLTVKAAATKKLALAAPSEATVASAFNVTLTATDEYGNPTVTYAGVKTLAWSGAASSPSGHAPEYPASATTVTFTNGVGTASEIDLYDASAAVTLTVKEGTLVKGSASIAVKATAAKELTFAAIAEQTAGSAFNTTLTAHDEYGNIATGYAGAKTLSWSGPAGSPSGHAPEYPATATTVTFTSGVGKATTIKLFDAQSTALRVTDGTVEGISGSFAVKTAATKKFNVPAPSEVEAGRAFNLTLTATDEWGNIATGYTGAKTLVWSGPASSPGGTSPEYPTSATAVSFSEGVGTASAIKLYDAQSTALKAKEGSAEGTSASLTVTPAAPERLAWAHPEVSAGKLETGSCPFACATTTIGFAKKFKAHASVTDMYGNVVSGLGATTKAKVEKTSGEGTLTNATALVIPASGLAESSTTFEYTSPASGTSEAVLKLKQEEGVTYTEAEAHVKY
jgi:trimeric autotransporter adhesin